MNKSIAIIAAFLFVFTACDNKSQNPRVKYSSVHCSKDGADLSDFLIKDSLPDVFASHIGNGSFKKLE